MAFKKSVVDCKQCSLHNAKSCIFEANTKNLSAVDIVFVAENPGYEEIKSGRPLVGPAGRIFRKPFDNCIKKYKDIKYLITNCVLCSTISNGKTSTPSRDVIDYCKENMFNFIRKCDPKLVVIMGNTPLYAFGIATGGITSKRGSIFRWEDWDVLATVHPSFILRGNTEFEDLFASDIEYAFKLITGESKPNISGEKGKKCLYSIPEKYYSKNYRLIDVQASSRLTKVIYIFRDIEGNKEYFTTDMAYYLYKYEGDNPKAIIEYDNLALMKSTYRDRFEHQHETILYEGNVKIENKHTIDYYLKSEGEADIPLKIMEIDIEVDTKGEKSFPKPEEARYPINSISYSKDGEVHTLLLHSKKKKISTPNVRVFKSEKSLILNFVDELKKVNPDVITGWNFIGFDLAYIARRMFGLRISEKLLSPFNDVWIETHRKNDMPMAKVVGFVVVDMLQLYKKSTWTKKESYSLDFISTQELGVGKLKYEGTLSELYRNDINQFIEYNQTDVLRLIQLNRKLDHINLRDELRKICSCSWWSCMNAMGLVDSLILSELKKNNLCAINNSGGEYHDLAGAYVRDPVVGVHNWVVDFDAVSLYPSIIRVFNMGPNTYVMNIPSEIAYKLIYTPDEVLLDEIYNVEMDPMNKKIYKTMTGKEIIDIINDNSYIVSISGAIFKSHEEEISEYYKIVGMLWNARDFYKEKMLKAVELNDEEEMNHYFDIQYLYKVIANSIYGVLGNKYYRFFNMGMANAITASGQEIIKFAGVHINELLKSGSTDIQIDFATRIEDHLEYLLYEDTDSMFIKLEDFIDQEHDDDNTIIEKIVIKCKKIEDLTNNILMTKFSELHKIRESKTTLRFKQETISRRIEFLAKKRYAMNLIYKEGKKIDKIEVMGIEIRRSDYSSVTKKRLEDLLELILKSDKISIPKLLEFKGSIEKELMERLKNRELILGRPSSFTKPIEEYKKIPMAVRGMIAWNKIMYDYFAHGSKGYLFKLQRFDLSAAPEDIRNRYLKYLKTNKSLLNDKGELDVITVPEEEGKLPDFFIPDIKAMVKLNWTDRADLILDPILDAKSMILKF